MTQKILNVAIIGCGRVAGHHLRAIDDHPSMRVVAISDINDERMKALTQSKEISHFKNYYEMMDRIPEIDIVAIITPSGMHYEHAYDIITNYKKHVVIEKPVVMTLEQAEKLGRAASSVGVSIFPVHQYRFNRCVQRIRAAIKDEELGKIHMATVRMRWCRPQSYYDRDPWRGTFALDGGCTTNQGIHHLDLLRYLNGEVKRVNCTMKTFGADIEVEDTVVATVEFENGALGNIEITTAARPHDFESSLSIVGSNGMAMLGGAYTDKLLEFSPNPSHVEKFSDSFEDAYGHGHKNIYSAAYNAILSDGEAAVTYEDAIKTIQLLHAFYVSAEKDMWIEVENNLSSFRLGREDDNLSNIYRASKAG